MTVFASWQLHPFGNCRVDRTSGLHFDPKLRPHILENNGDCLDDQVLGIGLAVHDHLVLGLLALANVHVMLAGKPIVPAAVPGGQPVGVLLPRPCQLGAGELLHVDEAIGVSIGAEIDLSARRGRRHCTKGRRDDQGPEHWYSPLCLATAENDSINTHCDIGPRAPEPEFWRTINFTEPSRPLMAFSQPVADSISRSARPTSGYRGAWLD